MGALLSRDEEYVTGDWKDRPLIGHGDRSALTEIDNKSADRIETRLLFGGEADVRYALILSCGQIPHRGLSTPCKRSDVTVIYVPWHLAGGQHCMSRVSA